MLFYLAPMEGITGYIVRNAYAHYFPTAPYPIRRVFEQTRMGAGAHAGKYENTADS